MLINPLIHDSQVSMVYVRRLGGEPATLERSLTPTCPLSLGKRRTCRNMRQREGSQVVTEAESAVMGL